MRGQSNLVREFIGQTDWATAENIAYLIYGKCDSSLKNDADWVLTQMLNAKKKDKRLKLLQNDFEKVYALSGNPNQIKGNYNLKHDIMLRNVLAVLKPDQCVCKRFDEDARIHINGKEYRIEMDCGYEDYPYLEAKLNTHYTGQGSYQAIFIMAQKPKGELEETRIDKLFELVESTLKYKKGRVLGAMYSQFLKDKKLRNWRGEWRLYLKE